jgi:hypothetical protein
MIEVKKLDKRNKGCDQFKYYIRTNGLTGPQVFHEIREWCWQTWGSSKEIFEWLNDQNRLTPVSCQNAHWTWQNDDYYRRIYLRTDQEYTMFNLRWM